MANEEQVAMLKRSVDEWNQWFHEQGFIVPDLSGADLTKINLRGVNLYGANLRGVFLGGSDLSDANLSNADLTGTESGGVKFVNADLSGTNLCDSYLPSSNMTKAKMHGANLCRADMGSANFSGAELNTANLSGTDLTSADFRGADLYRVLFDVSTRLDRIKLDTKTNILGTRWNGAALDEIEWKNAPQLGDEPTSEARLSPNPQERALRYRNAARAYHGLVIALSDQGLSTTASQYHLRERVMERKALRYERNFGGWFLNVLLGAVAGHGEKPGRAFGAYLGVVTFFAVIFWLVTNVIHTGSPPLQWYEAGVLSLSSFHGRGFFTNTIQLGDPLAIVAAFEAVSGLFIELVFIATFTQRFFSK